MRFPEDKIKEAILHPDLEIRDRATDYFAKSYSHDVSIMAQVIKAVETYGRQDAYRLIGPSRDLPQTAESIAWVIDELNDDQSDRYENYTYNLSMVLVEADPALLLPKESAILEARHFLPDLRPAIDRPTADALVGRGDLLAEVGRVLRGGKEQAVHQRS